MLDVNSYPTDRGLTEIGTGGDDFVQTLNMFFLFIFLLCSVIGDLTIHFCCDFFDLYGVSWKAWILMTSIIRLFKLYIADFLIFWSFVLSYATRCTLEKRGLKIKDEEKTLHYVKIMHIILKVACLQKIILYVIIITFPSKHSLCIACLCAVQTHANFDGEISLSAYKALFSLNRVFLL
ncbi:hypothetical protein ACJX0J_032412 [Zea mays]